MRATLAPRVRVAAAACSLLGALAACSSAGSGALTPNTAGNATAVPGAVPTLGDGSGGGITVTNTRIVRTGTKLAVSATIHSDESTADELDQVSSQVTTTVILSPPLRIPAGGTVTIGSGSANPVVLVQNNRLEPDGTLVLSLQFGKAGAVQVFSGFHDAS